MEKKKKYDELRITGVMGQPLKELTALAKNHFMSRNDFVKKILFEQINSFPKELRTHPDVE